MAGAHGQQPESTDIVTDRPDVTESSMVVPKGGVQLENGMSWTQNHRDESIDLTETLARFGIFERTELRLELPNYLAAAPGSSAASGFSDVAVGVKQQLGALRGGIDLALIVAIDLPSGSQRVSSHGFDPFLKLPWSKELSQGWSIGGMESFFWTTENGRRNPTWETTIMAEKELLERLAVFVEYAGDFRRNDGSEQIGHVGAAYKLTRNQQLDCHLGFGLSTAAPQHFLSFGYSIRFDNLIRERVVERTANPKASGPD